jgi:hypothetical protein
MSDRYPSEIRTLRLVFTSKSDFDSDHGAREKKGQLSRAKAFSGDSPIAERLSILR